MSFERKDECTFSLVEFFCDKYSNLLDFSPVLMDRLQEFVDYQFLEESHIPPKVWEESAIYKDNGGKVYHRMDVIWGHIATVKNADSSEWFANLCEVAKLILVIPDSNAGEERVFNLIKQNKTTTCSCLDPNGTLSSLITETSKH